MISRLANLLRRGFALNSGLTSLVVFLGDGENIWYLTAQFAVRRSVGYMAWLTAFWVVQKSAHPQQKKDPLRY
jgi:hypothetical protein